VAPVDPDRPRYRVLAQPIYDHEPDARPEHPDGAGHDRDCAAGYELLIYRVDRYTPAPNEVLGVTQTPGRDAGGFRTTSARQAVCDYVRLRSEPLSSRIEPSDVELYLLVPEELP